MRVNSKQVIGLKLTGSGAMRGSGFCPSRFSPVSVILVIISLCMPEQALAQSKNTFPMPDVIGLTVQQAQKRVLTAGSETRASSARAIVYARQSDARPAGQIIKQLEPPDTPKRPYTDDVGGKYGEVTFQVVVSTGPDPAQNSDERTMDKAVRDAQPGKSRLGAGTEEMISKFLQEMVREVAKPRDGFPMPNVIGLTVPEAEQKVLLAGREIQAGSAQAVVNARQTDARPAGQIIRQLEPPGTLMRPYTDDVGGNYGEVTFGVRFHTPTVVCTHTHEPGTASGTLPPVAMSRTASP